MAAFAGVDLNRRCAGGADAVGIKTGLLVALDDGHAQAGVALLERLNGGAQQRGFARARAGHQIQGGDAVRLEMQPVLPGRPVVFTEDVGFDLDGAFLAHARHRDTGSARAEVQVAGLRVDLRAGAAGRSRRMRRSRPCLRGMIVVMGRMDFLAAVGATADDTHDFFLYSSATNISMTRNSVPPVGCNW